MKADNKYTKMQSDYYENTAADMAKMNHRHHDNNFDYWSILLKPIREDSKKWENCNALDFGCGTGRNVCNLLRMANWARVDGVDISENNLKLAREILTREGITPDKYKLVSNNGVDLKDLSDSSYDFIMSTIVFQHIAVHEIRYSLMQELFRALKSGGIFSFQMGYGEGYGKAEYNENAYDAEGTNTRHDVIVRSPEQLQKDLEEIGFINFKYVIRPSFSDGHPSWLFFTALK